ncbi:MAG TPA: ABC transporter permease [Vicinamibacterales bacterium]|nr:ABC transporter permease [Vicinamibacterales bacterium]
MDALLNDLRYTLRTLLKAPAFTLAAVAAITLGIGANTAIFSVVNAVLLRPLSAPDPDRVVFFMNTSPQGSGPAASPAKFAHWSQQTAVIEQPAAFNTMLLNYSGAGGVEQLRGGRVSSQFFRLFGVPIVRGRAFSADEDRPSGDRVAVLSHGLWTRRFGADPAIVGRILTLGSEPYTVVGIVGPSFDVDDWWAGPSPELWVPFQLDPNSSDQGNYFRSAARLKPGVTLQQAQARMQLAADEFRAKYPTALGKTTSFGVERVQTILVRNVRTTLFVLAGAVGFVLLIACANVANLLLVRATGKRREIAIRAAIGAGRGRIVRQLITESFVLSLAGGTLGLVLGVVGIRALLTINTAGLPRIGTDGGLVSVDWRVLTFATVVSLLTGLLFGLIPSLQAARTDLSSTLKESAGRSGTGFRQNRMRAILVVAEVALALVLLVGSALLIRTSLALRAVDPGFDAAHVLTMRMSVSSPQFMKADAVERLVRAGVERLRSVPGVEAASATCCVPLEGGYGLPFIIAGRPLKDAPSHGGGGWLTVSPGYFEVFRIAMKRGRSFSERDDAQGAPVVIVNEAFVRQYLKDDDPLRERLVIGKSFMREFASEQPRQIIGVASDVRDGGLNNDPQPTMYVPQAQIPDSANALNVRLTPIAWVVRTRAAPYTVSAAVQDQLRQISNLPVSDVRSMEDVVSRSISRQRFNMLLMTVFGAAALLLAAIGIYGLMAYAVEQRTQEIGIRLALGADSTDVRRMVIGQGMRLAGAGVVVGLAVALGLARLIASLLYGVTARDPMVFAGAPIVLSLVSLVGVWLPAIRAVNIDPVIALRAE